KTKMPCDVLMSKYLFSILAMTDVPPITLPEAITNPIPTPNKTPPNEAFITKLSIHVLKFSVKSKKIEIAVLAINVYTAVLVLKKRQHTIMTNVFIINEDIDGEKQKAYFNANDIPTLPPLNKIDSNINDITHKTMSIT